MDNSFQTSFIPKRPITSTGNSTRPPTNIFTSLAFLLLIIMGIAAGSLYIYKNYLIKQKETLSSSLTKVRDSFEKDTIAELELYDKRESAAKKVLDGHIVFSPMFSLLGNLTIPSIQYTSFNEDTLNKEFNVKLSGVALDYRSIALQADVFNSAKGRSFRDVVFSNLNKDKNNHVTFDLNFTVDPALLSYEKDLLLEQVQSKIYNSDQRSVNTNPSVNPSTINGTNQQ